MTAIFISLMLFVVVVSLSTVKHPRFFLGGVTFVLLTPIALILAAVIYILWG